MATETENYGYPKPEEDDFYDINLFNQVMEMIDKDLKEIDETKQSKLGIGIFKGDIDALGDDGLPQTSSVCWCQAKVLRGTLPYESQYDYWFTLETNITLENQPSGIRNQRAVVYGEDNIRIFERLYTNAQWYEWRELLRANGDLKDTTVTFESGDNVNPTGWADVALVTTKEKLSSLFRKFSLTVKNMRYLWKLIGNTSLSGIGNGTITGAISSLNTDILTLGNRYISINVGSNSGRKLSFAGHFSCIISVDGFDSSSFGAFFAQGYGIYQSGAERIHIAKIQAGLAITCYAIEGEEAVFVKNTSMDVKISVFMFYGDLPVISTLV